MLIRGVMSLSPTGRVLVTLGAIPVGFNGGTPIAADGTIAGSLNTPDFYIGGFGYTKRGAICARVTVPAGFFQGGLARDSVGSLALNTTDPIVGYLAGIPVCADGRMAVQ